MAVFYTMYRLGREVVFTDRKTDTEKRGTIRAVHITAMGVSYTVEAPNDYHSGTNQSIITEGQIKA